MLKDYSKNQTAERIRDMANLVTELQNANRLLLASDRENMGGNIHRYEDLLTPWCQYFGGTMSKARQAVKRLYNHDATRAEVVTLIGELIDVIQREIKAVRAELIMQSIREAFSKVETIAEARELANTIETAKFEGIESWQKAHDEAAKASATRMAENSKNVPAIKITNVTKSPKD